MRTITALRLVLLGAGICGCALAGLGFLLGPVGPGLSESVEPCSSRVHDYRYIAVIQDFRSGEVIANAEVVISSVEKEKYNCAGPTPTLFEPIVLTSDKNGQFQAEFRAVDEQYIGISVIAEGYKPFTDTLGSAADLDLNNGRWKVYLTNSSVPD